MSCSGRGEGGRKRKPKDNDDSRDDDDNAKWTPSDCETGNVRPSGVKGGRPQRKKQRLSGSRVVDHDSIRRRTCALCLSVCSVHREKDTRDLRDNAILLSRFLKFMVELNYDIEDNRLPVGLCSPCRLSISRELARDDPNYLRFSDYYSKFISCYFVRWFHKCFNLLKL